jgi:PGF-pre-PGF domain-containing protein
VKILGNNITGGEGIFSINLSNSVIEQNIINCSIYYSGVYLIDSDSNNVTGNQIGNGSYGIYLDGSNNNKLVNNFVTNNDDNDFYSNRSSNNVITNLTTTDTSSNFTYAGELELTHADDIAPPTNYGDINHFLNISGDRWISINVSYKDSDVFGVNTSTIRLWKYSSGSWSNLTGSVNGINTAGKYVYANITNFSSTFAPLGTITATCELVCDSESCVENNDTPGVIICLNASINAALTIAADNQTLDCNGYSLTGTGSDYGVNVSRKVNVTVKNCDIHSFDYCINIFRTNYSYVIDNNIDNCTTVGIVVSGTGSGYNSIIRNAVNNSNVGILISGSDNDNLTNNTIVNSSQNDLDLSDVPGLLVMNLVLNDTAVSFILDGDATLDWEPSSSAPTGYSIIGHALDITKNSGSLWLYLNISYSNSDIAGIADSSLRLWKNSSGEWNQKLNESGTLVSGVNTAANYVYANISNFSSVYALFGVSSVVSDCRNITVPGAYALNQSLSGNQSNGICVDIQTGNTTLDCVGHNMTGISGSETGIFVGKQSNVTIKNCVITYYPSGIYINESSNVTAQNNTVFTSYVSLYSGFSNNTLFYNNTAYNCSLLWGGIYFFGEHGCNATKNVIYHNTFGLMLSLSDGCYISNNSVYDNYYDGFYLEYTNNTNFVNNRAQNNSRSDFYSSYGNSVNNTVTNLTTNDTISSFIYDGSVHLKNSNGTGRPNPTGYSNISHYLELANGSLGGANAWIFINISYKDSDLPPSITESSLRIWKNSSGSWNQNLNSSGNLVSGVNTAANYVYANISNFSSVFAPMGSMPMSITVGSPLNRSYNNQTLWFNITTNYNSFTCRMNLDGHGNVTMQNSSLKNWYNQTTGLAEGLRNVTYWCNDTGGLTSDQKLIYFGVDVTKPYINITAPHENETINRSSAVYVNATVNEDASACKASFDNSTNITLTNSSDKRNWTGSDNFANGNHDVIVYCSDLAGNWNVSKKVSFTVYIPPEEEGVGGGGTGGFTTQNATSITLVWPAIAENGSYSMSTPVDSIDIVAVIIKVKSQLKAGGLLQILQYNNRTTATTDAPDKQYKYFYFSATNIVYSNIDKATIKFRVLKSWINTTGIDSDTIKMYRFTSIWNVLDTVQTGEDSKYFYYDAFTTAFSYFAITGSAVSGVANVTEQPNETTPTVITQPTTGPISACGNGICGVGEDSTNCPVDCGAAPSMAIETPMIILIGVIIAAVISIVAVFLLVVKPRMEAKQYEMGGPAMAGLPQVPGIEMEQRPSFIEVEIPPAKEHQLEGYVRRNLVKGITPQQIEAVLDKVGWRTEQIKNAFDLATTPPEKEEDLIGYVARMETKGFTPQQIRARLIQAGWKPTEVFHVMKMAAERMRGR